MSFIQRFLPVDADTFREKYYEQRVLHHPAQDRVGPPSIPMDAGDIDRVLRSSLPASEVRVIRAGVTLAPFEYSRTYATTTDVAARAVEADLLTRALLDGYSITVRRLERFFAPAADAVAQLIAELHRPVWINLFLTPKDSQALPAHYDTHDVFVVQLLGRKQWQLSGPVSPRPLRDEVWGVQPAARREQLLREIPRDIELEMCAGDVLYVPRGALHEARATRELSAHLTVAIDNGTRSDLALALVRAGQHADWFRRALPFPGDDTDPVTASDIVHHLELAAGTVDGAALAWDTELATSGESHRGAVGPLAQLDAVESLSAETVVALRPGLRHTILRRGTDTLVAMPQRTVRVPRLTPADVEGFLTPRPRRVSDIDVPVGLDVKLKLVDILLRADVLTTSSDQFGETVADSR